MFYIIYLHVNQSVDSILITPVNVQIRNDTWDSSFTLITPIYRTCAKCPDGLGAPLSIFVHADFL